MAKRASSALIALPIAIFVGGCPPFGLQYCTVCPKTFRDFNFNSSFIASLFFLCLCPSHISMVQMVVLEISHGGLYSGPGNKNSLGTARATLLVRKTVSKAQIKTNLFIFSSSPKFQFFSSLRDSHCKTFIPQCEKKPSPLSFTLHFPITSK